MPYTSAQQNSKQSHRRALRTFMVVSLSTLQMACLAKESQAQQSMMGANGVAPTIPKSQIRSVPGRRSIPQKPVRSPQIQPPGPESFAVPPRTPLEFWDAADYLVRSGQPTAAVPYLNSFLQSKPDDATLIELRDKFGVGSILRLEDHPATAGLARQILSLVQGATTRVANEPERVSKAIDQLTGTPDEQTIGIEQLRQAGAGAVPPLLKALSQPGRSPEERVRLAECLGRLDGRAVPPLIAALDAPNPAIAADAATALGRLKDRRAIQGLLFPAGRGDVSPVLGDAARGAIRQLTGQPFTTLPKAPAQRLTDLAWQYHRGRASFPSDVVEFWAWKGDEPKPFRVSQAEAASQIGMKLARESLHLDPTNLDAQKALISLELEHAARGPGGPETVASRDPEGAYSRALVAGPDVLGSTLKSAIADGHGPLAEVLIGALGKVTNPVALAVPGQPDPIIDALSAPDRRVQFAAAETLINLNPPSGFAGSSRVVPVLARFLGARAAAPRAVVIDGSSARGSATAATLRDLGYDAQVASDGQQGFRDAVSAAETELVLIDPTSMPGHWNWLDTITNLRADARTAGIPIFLTGPRQIDDMLRPSFDRFPRTEFLYTPSDPRKVKPMLDKALAGMGVNPLTPAERERYAQGAAALLAKVAAQPGSPYAHDLAAIEPDLSLALRNPGNQVSSSNALADVGTVEAQRSLVEALLDPAQPLDFRRNAGQKLLHSIERFGPLLVNSQEQRLLERQAVEPDAAIQNEMTAVITALRPQSAARRGLFPRVAPSFSQPSNASPSLESVPLPGEPVFPHR